MVCKIVIICKIEKKGIFPFHSFTQKLIFVKKIVEYIKNYETYIPVVNRKRDHMF